MKRVIALSLFALASTAACAFVFWPRAVARHAPQEVACTSGSETSAPTVNSAPPGTSDPDSHVEPNAAAWPRFLEACRARQFAAAEHLLPSVVGLPAELRSEMLALPREQDWSETDAAALRKLAGSVLVVREEREREIVCSAALSEYEKCWPRLAELNADRTANMAIRVDGEPLDVPEREGLPAGDWLLVDALLAAMQGEANQLQQARLLFEKAADKNWSERTYLEPLLSGLLVARQVDANAGTRLLAGEFVECRNLTPRLVFELRLIVLGNRKAARDFLTAIGPKDSNIEVLLREALKNGLTQDELLLLVVPYLESRFGGRKAVSILFGSTFSWIDTMTSEQRASFAFAAAERFENSEPGAGMASAYFQLLNHARAGRDVKELPNVMLEAEPGASSATPLVSPQQAAHLREAILKHRSKMMELLGDELLPTGNLADLCDAAVECSQDLREAVAALVQLLSPRKVLENSGLRQGFGRVLMRVRARFHAELANDFVQREKLIRLSEDVLDMTREEFVSGGVTRKDGLIERLLFADQLLAICAISPEIAVTSTTACNLREVASAFEKECLDRQTNPPVVQPKYKRYLEVYERVVARLKDPKLSPVR